MEHTLSSLASVARRASTRVAWRGRGARWRGSGATARRGRPRARQRFGSRGGISSLTLNAGVNHLGSSGSYGCPGALALRPALRPVPTASTAPPPPRSPTPLPVARRAARLPPDPVRQLVRPESVDEDVIEVLPLAVDGPDRGVGGRVAGERPYLYCGAPLAATPPPPSFAIANARRTLNVEQGKRRRFIFYLHGEGGAHETSRFRDEMSHGVSRK